MGVALILLHLSPIAVEAQQNQVQRARDAGYQNGVNDARNNRPMNLNSNDWHGDRLTAYQQAYQEGYWSVRGGGGENGWQVYQDPEAQRAYRNGYQNGLRAQQNNRPMNLNTDDWHGNRLAAYQHGYQQGYGSVQVGTGVNGWQAYQDPEAQRAYKNGYQNGVRDLQNNRAMNPNSDDWRGNRLAAYQQGYREGYGSGSNGGGGENGWRNYQNTDDQRAYQAGYRNGSLDRQANRLMNMNTDDWHGNRLEIYRQGYEQGYRGNRDRDDYRY
jgi:hypothetical protein